MARGITFLPVWYDPGRVWVFKDGKYARIQWDIEQPRVVTNPTDFRSAWSSLKQAGFTRIDAALARPNGYTYLFSGDKYTAVYIDRLGNDTSSYAGSKPISDWPSIEKIGFKSIDATLAVPGTSGDYWLFSGHEYGRINLSSNNTDTVVHERRLIADGWPGLRFVGIDDILPHSTQSDQAYFFSGPNYVRLKINSSDPTKSEVMYGVRDVARAWPDLLATGFYSKADMLLGASFADSNNPVVLNTKWRTSSDTEVQRDFQIGSALGVTNGNFVWGGHDFQKSSSGLSISSDNPSQAPQLFDIFLSGTIKNEQGQNVKASTSITENLKLVGDKVQLFVRCNIEVGEQDLDAVAAQLDEYIANNDVKIVVPPQEKGVEEQYFLVVPSAGSIDDGIKVTYAASAELIAERIIDKHSGLVLDQYVVGAEASISQLHMSAGVTAYASRATIGALQVTVGAGLEVGVGIKDESIDVEVGIASIKIGRKIGVSVFGGTGFEIDLAKLWPW
ncbi:hypothetical protein BDV93DRAFT_547901 [Ceratobasidium sp. AG-I]|nr:hypothetical protein BDV93DRAFT_547901 [Ceratobasidium sp. AG-I]